MSRRDIWSVEKIRSDFLRSVGTSGAQEMFLRNVEIFLHCSTDEPFANRRTGFTNILSKPIINIQHSTFNTLHPSPHTFSTPPVLVS